jgi:hypothetical protein
LKGLETQTGKILFLFLGHISKTFINILVSGCGFAATAAFANGESVLMKPFLRIRIPNCLILFYLCNICIISLWKIRRCFLKNRRAVLIFRKLFRLLRNRFFVKLIDIAPHVDGYKIPLADEFFNACIITVLFDAPIAARLLAQLKLITILVLVEIKPKLEC